MTIIDLTDVLPPIVNVEEFVLSTVVDLMREGPDGYARVGDVVRAGEAKGLDHYAVWEAIEHLEAKHALEEPLVGLVRTDRPYALAKNPCEGLRHAWKKESGVLSHGGCFDYWVCERCGAGAQGEDVRQAVRECVDDR